MPSLDEVSKPDRLSSAQLGAQNRKTLTEYVRWLASVTGLQEEIFKCCLPCLFTVISYY